MGKKRSHSKEDSLLTEKKRRLKEYNSSSSSEEEGGTRHDKPDKKQKARHRHKSKSKAKHKKKKRKVYTESSSSDDSSRSETSSSASSSEKSKKKHKKAKRKLKKSKHKKVKNETEERMTTSDNDLVSIGPLPPEGLSEKAKSMTPMTKEEWEKRQCVVKRVFDEETGRHRLVKGDGEIVEEIVSRDRHKEINRQATAGDGSFFQNKVHNKLKSL